MLTRKFLNTLVSLVMITSLILGGVTQASAQEPKTAHAQTSIAGPASPTDESKVPHYFGPYPNYANSPLTVPDALVTIAPSPVSTVTVGNPLLDRSNATDYATAPGTLGPVFVVIPGATLPAGTLTSFQTWNQATPGSSPTPSAGNLFHAYVLHPTGVVNQYQVVYDSGELTVPALADPAVSALATFPVAPGIAVQAGDVLGFYGEGMPLDVGGGTDFLVFDSMLVTPVVAPLQSDTITLGDPGFPIFSQDRTYSFAATVDPAAVDPGTGVTATAMVDPATGGISGFTITNPGSGYLSAPKVSITSANGINATATAVLNPFYMLTKITVDSVGASYTAPVVAITGGGATTPATAHASGSVDSLTITNGGSGFTLQPMVEISWPDDPAGTPATASATMTNGVVDSITIVDHGSGYYSAPTVTITDGLYPSYGDGVGATAAATLSISEITLDTFGSGYTAAPMVDITDTLGAGSNAAATAVVTSGSISAINVGNPGSGYLTPGIKKFVDTLPGLGPTAANNLGQYIPVAIPDKTTYPGTDYYEIAVVQYRMKMHSSLPATLLRGYVQLSTSVVPGAHVTLSNANLVGADTPINGYFGVDSPHYLGPTIVATKDRPVRILFRNLLPKGVDGDLFLPVDTTVMGSGMGPLADQTPPVDNGSVMDEVRNPMCNQGFMANMPDQCYTQNRATLHLHGGITPWISDGTPHQWITPAGENTAYPEGVSVSNVPDMPDPGPGAQTFFYTNQQSARLMFYHDHSWGITRLNVYGGEAAGYVLTDAAEQSLISAGGPLAGLSYGIPLIIQDKTFVPSPSQLAQEDPTWDTSRWGGMGNLWVPHVMMPAQNPGSSTGQSDFGRWMYGPYFWPPATPKYGPIDNPYYDPNCDSNVILPDGSNQFCEPPLIPGVPNQSVGMEAFNDTPVVNGTAYPTTTLDPKSYRFRILNAANDRFWNLQWYVADPRTGTLSEVALNPADLAAAQTNPDVVPQPDLAFSPAGPDWVQIGTEGGFLPTPTVVSGHQPTTWIVNPTRFDVGNVDLHSLLLAPAERADVVVDFSKYAGKTLILYNDAPAAFPARVAGYDYYTGDPDMTGSGGAPTTLPGYGPNTRTIMQVKIAAKTPAAAFKIGPLNAAFAHHLVNGQPAGIFESSEDPIIVGQGAYNTAYGTTFRSSAPRDGFARINDMSLTFNTLLNGAGGATMTIPFENKGIHDEMNSATFDDYGRMSANLGLEAPGATPLTQNIILYPYINPVTEILNGVELPAGSLKVTPISSAADGTQIWKITHNGVDTHPLHFHLFNVQVINRVTWDNIILPPEPSELGWKDTVRVSPLEDTIVAFRPIVMKLPFGIPDSIRPLNPAMPLGDTSGFNQMDPLGNAPATPYSNILTNFGWEYVWHCHILGHEEMDMMRPIKFNVSRGLPDVPVLTFTRGSVILHWTDGTPVNYADPANWGNPKNEIGFKIERALLGANGVPGAYSVITTAPANTTTYTDLTTIPGWNYNYRVTAFNQAGGSTSVELFVPALAPADPTGLIATAINSNRVDLTWADNAANELGYSVQRCTGAGCTNFVQIDSLGSNATAYTDPSVQPNTSYVYQVVAFNMGGNSLPSNAAPVTTPDVPPVAPSGLSASAISATQVNLTWLDNSANETGFRVERAIGNGAFQALGTVNANVKNYSDTTASPNTTYAYRVFAFNVGGGDSLPSNVAMVTTPDVVPVAPSGLAASAISPTQINLTWTDNSANETGFRVERCAGAACTNFAALPGSLAANTVSFSDSGLTPNTSYSYRVVAFNTIGDSLPSNTATATTLSALPAAPSNLVATAVSSTQINLSWTDNASNETGFTIQRATNAAFTNGLNTITLTAPNQTAYINLNRQPNTTYYYRVQAFNALGASGWSNVASAFTAVPSSPAAPSNLTAAAFSKAQINLTWTDTANNETGFTIQRSTSINFTGTTTITLNAVNQVAYSDTGRQPNTTYYYRIRAFNAIGSSAWSNTASATTLALVLPAAPSGLSATAFSPSQINLAWTDNATNETGFTIQRSTNANFTGPNTTTLNAANQTSYSSLNRQPNTTYYYRVQAFNADGPSAWSNTASATTPNAIPSVPAGLTVTAPPAPAGRTSLVIAWTYTSNGTPGPITFQVQRSNNGNGGWTTVANNLAATTFTNNGLPTGTLRYYRVRALSATGNSAWTTVVSGSTRP